MKLFKIVNQYYISRKKEQITIIEWIDDEDIMEILGEITQDQLSNVEITIEHDQTRLYFEEFIIDRNIKNYTNSIKKSEKQHFDN